MTTPPNPDAPTVRTDVPMEAHPDYISGHRQALDVESTPGQHAWNDGRAALTTIYDTIGRMNDALSAVADATAPSGKRMQNGRPTLNFVASEELVQAAEKAFNRAATLVDARVASLDRQIKALDTKVETALNALPVEPEVGNAIRQHIKSLKAEKRLAFASKAVEDGDPATTAALLRAPAYLSGLETKNLDLLRERAAMKFAGQDHAQLVAARRVREQVRRAGAHLTVRYAEVVGQRSGPRAKAAKTLKTLAGEE